jgi:hypothetical protein
MARKIKIQYESESEDEKLIEEEIQEIVEVPTVINEKKPRTQKQIDATNNMRKALLQRREKEILLKQAKLEHEELQNKVKEKIIKEKTKEKSNKKINKKVNQKVMMK